ncbi:MAG: DUF2252 family protein [Archangium sp.]|nr:DUF2252 family protein [Archangium sp.]
MLRLVLIATLVSACGGPPIDSREAELATVIARADEVLLRSRPSLVAGRYQRMAATPFDFYRGNLAVFRHDWELGRTSRSGFLGAVPPVWGLADPHPENFGVLIASDGTAAIEPNDFDSADRVPSLFDLRRLVAGLVVAMRQANVQFDSRAVVIAAVNRYSAVLHARAAGQPPVRVTVNEPKDTIGADLFKRSRRDLAARAELGGLTEVVEGKRRFKRGVLDADEPTQVLAELPPSVQAELPSVLRRLGERDGKLLHAVREFGSGVASWPRVRLLLLLEGPTDAPGDDVILEVKELSESAVAGWYRPALPSTDTPSRVEGAARRAWARPDADPRFFATSWLGLPVLVRTESEAFKGIRVSRMAGDRGTEAAFTALGELCGGLLARVHAGSEPEIVRQIVEQIDRGPEVFADEQAAFAEDYATQVLADQQHFAAALARLGPTLGIQHDVREQAPSVAASLFGVAP